RRAGRDRREQACSPGRGRFALRRSCGGELEMRGEILDALMGSEPCERRLASRERPLVARAPAGADFVLAATARALESPILAVASGPQDAEQLARGVGGWLGQERVALLPAWESLPYEGISPAPEVAARRHE